MVKRVSFLARSKTRKKVAFRAGGKRVSFTASVPSKRRKKVSFLATERR